MKSKNFIIDLVIYPFQIMVSIGQSDKKLKKCLKEFGVEWSDDFILKTGTRGRCLLNEENQTLIRLKELKTPEDYGTLQHELFHAVTFILERIGMEFDLNKSDEAYAYLIGYITQEVYKRLKK
jgi:hypothetical protein